jgi:hypothetical protein
MLLNLPRVPSGNRPPAAERAAGLIYQEALTAVGRSMDEVRERYQKLKPPASMPLQSFGCYRIHWPRQRLLECATFRLAALTVQRWYARKIDSEREKIASWFEDEWRRKQLDPASLLSLLTANLTTALGAPAQQLIESEIRAVAETAGKADASELMVAVDRVFQLVGQTDTEGESSPSRLGALAEDAGKSIARSSAVKFAKMAVYFIEQPGSRLAAAEEAIRLGTTRLHGLIDQYDKKVRGLGDESADEFRRLATLLNAASGARRGPPTSELMSRLRSWAQNRLEFLLNRAIASIYRQMLGNAPGYVREVNACRQQLDDFAAHLNSQATAQSQSMTEQDHPIMVAGCKNLLEYADRVIDRLPEDEFNRFEEKVQYQIRRQFRALLSACGVLNEQRPRLQHLMTEEARTLLDTRLGHHSSAHELFVNRPDEQAIHREMLRAYDECAPEPFGPLPKSEAQSFILGVAEDEWGDRLQNIVQELMPHVKIDVAKSNNDVVLYREYHDLAISEVPQAGILGADAVHNLQKREKIQIHSRTDVSWPN